MKVKKILLSIGIIATGRSIAQSVSTKIVENDLTTMHKLQIRPSIGFAIPYTQVNGTPNVLALNVDAQYWVGTKLDCRASLMFGGFKGGSIGATYHLKDNIVPTKQKFILSRSTKGRTETTTFVKLKPDSRNIFGACADLNIGIIKGSGFATRADIGIDFQSFSRAFAEINESRYASSRNGWFSLKLAACIASVNYDSPTFVMIPTKRVLGVGGLANLNAITRPWKSVCLSTGIQMGALKAIGIDPLDKEDSILPIFSFNLGVSININ